MTRTDHTAVSVPKELHSRINEIVEKSEGRYSSVAHFIKFAVESQIVREITIRDLKETGENDIGGKKISESDLRKIAGYIVEERGMKSAILKQLKLVDKIKKSTP